ncbi:hypothetical protein AWB68_08288 [Caballeronia choica]|uniref:Uncharacterized protein n=1 Tax=Caballeronia choica TaxID=326476 RepID=A0A158L2R2_9BURK|nr:hypothetical protein AWB68_08288 [Caballeronia choica]
MSNHQQFSAEPLTYSFVDDAVRNITSGKLLPQERLCQLTEIETESERDRRAQAREPRVGLAQMMQAQRDGARRARPRAPIAASRYANHSGCRVARINANSRDTIWIKRSCNWRSTVPRHLNPRQNPARGQLRKAPAPCPFDGHSSTLREDNIDQHIRHFYFSPHLDICIWLRHDITCSGQIVTSVFGRAKLTRRRIPARPRRLVRRSWRSSALAWRALQSGICLQCALPDCRVRRQAIWRLSSSAGRKASNSARLICLPHASCRSPCRCSQ